MYILSSIRACVHHDVPVLQGGPGVPVGLLPVVAIVVRTVVMEYVVPPDVVGSIVVTIQNIIQQYST